MIQTWKIERKDMTQTWTNLQADMSNGINAGHILDYSFGCMGAAEVEVHHSLNVRTVPAKCAPLWNFYC